MSFYTKALARLRQTKKPKLMLLSNGLYVAAIGLLVIGLCTGLSDWRTNQRAVQHATRLVYEANHNISHVVPSTIKPIPSAFDSYKVAASSPRYIFIPKLSVQAIVRPLGLTAAGGIATPANVYDAGWYTKSSKPGQPGAMLVDGHVSSWTTNGVFHDLKLLRVGDIIQIERGDGIQISYAVAKKQVYDYQQVPMADILSPTDAGKQSLNLITCAGKVIKGTNEFNQRLVIFAVQT